MTGRRRRELADSCELLATHERWFFVDLFVGLVAFALWISATGALSMQIETRWDVALGLHPGETPTTLSGVFFGVLWVVLPSLVGLVRFRQRLLNLRGNVEQCYRLDTPVVLLVLPGLLVLLTGVALVVLGSIPWYLTLAVVPVGLFVLVRTLAYSYRVYAFSHPLFVQLLIALSIAAMIVAGLSAVATPLGREQLFVASLRSAGLPRWPTGDVAFSWLSFSPVRAAVFLPVVGALLYVLAQRTVAKIVRARQPTVDRSKMRTGQRYPPFLTTARTTSTPSGGRRQEGATSGTTDDAKTPVDPVDETSDATGEGDDTARGDNLDDVSHTRVFTPPTEGTDDDNRCPVCGDAIPPDDTVHFCPSCGAKLDQ